MNANGYDTPRPVLEAFSGALAFARSPAFSDCVVAREEYLEAGSNASRRKFRDWKPTEKESKGKEVLRGRSSGKGRDEDDEDEDGPPRKVGRGRGRGGGASYRKRGG